jgi:DNA-binding CsgD family transcriptional regulator
MRSEEQYNVDLIADEVLEAFASFHQALDEAKPQWIWQGHRAAHGIAASPRAQILTQRETEVLNWLAKGKTNRDIADILGMSPRTVNKHLEHIYVKLGVETRTAAVAVAREHYGVMLAV